MRSISFDTSVDKLLYYKPSDYTRESLSENLTPFEREFLEIYNVLATNDFNNLWHWKFNDRTYVNENKKVFDISRTDVFKFAQTVHYKHGSLFLEALSLGWVEEAKHYLGRFIFDLGRALKPKDCVELITVDDAQRILNRALSKIKHYYSTAWRSEPSEWLSVKDIAPYGYGKSKDIEEAKKYYV